MTTQFSRERKIMISVIGSDGDKNRKLLNIAIDLCKFVFKNVIGLLENSWK
jgi:hypothetical protein